MVACIVILFVVLACSCESPADRIEGTYVLDGRETSERLILLSRTRPGIAAEKALCSGGLQGRTLAEVSDKVIRNHVASWRGVLEIESVSEVLGFKLALFCRGEERVNLRGVIYVCPPSQLHVQHENGKLLSRYYWLDCETKEDLIVVRLDEGVLAFRKSPGLGGDMERADRVGDRER